jgi:hypothetical protein
MTYRRARTWDLSELAVLVTGFLAVARDDAERGGMIR